MYATFPAEPVLPRRGGTRTSRSSGVRTGATLSVLTAGALTTREISGPNEAGMTGGVFKNEGY